MRCARVCTVAHRCVTAGCRVGARSRSSEVRAVSRAGDTRQGVIILRTARRGHTGRASCRACAHTRVYAQAPSCIVRSTDRPVWGRHSMSGRVRRDGGSAPPRRSQSFTGCICAPGIRPAGTCSHRAGVGTSGVAAEGVGRPVVQLRRGPAVRAVSVSAGVWPVARNGWPAAGVARETGAFSTAARWSSAAVRATESLCCAGGGRGSSSAVVFTRHQHRARIRWSSSISRAGPGVARPQAAALVSRQRCAVVGRSKVGRRGRAGGQASGGVLIPPALFQRHREDGAAFLLPQPTLRRLRGGGGRCRRVRRHRRR